MHISNIKNYPTLVNRLYINPINNKRYVFFYLSENLSLDVFLSVVNTKYLKYAFVPNNPKFKTVLNQDLKEYFKQYGLKALNNLASIPANSNFIVDLNLVINKLKQELKISNPLQLRKWLIVYFQWLNQEFFSNIPNTEKVFIYSCDPYGEPYPINIVYRNIGMLLPVLLQEKVLDYFLVLFKSKDRILITSLITPIKRHEDKNIISFIKNRLIHRSYKSQEIDDTDKIFNIEDIDKEKQDQSITQTSDQAKDQTSEKDTPAITISSKMITQSGDQVEQHKTDGSQIIISSTAIDKGQSLVHSQSSEKSKEDDKSIIQTDEERFDQFFNQLSSTEGDVIQYRPIKIQNTDPLFKHFNFEKVYDHNNFSAIFQKRISDFQQNFVEQLTSLFKILENQNLFPLKLVSIVYQDNLDPEKINNIYPSYYVDYIVRLKDESLNKVFEIKISIPKIFENGYFIINGHKKYVVYQLIHNPIIFEKRRNEGKFISFYATNIITLSKNTFYLYISGFNVPLIFVLLAFYDWDTIATKFGFLYKLSDMASKNTDDICIKLPDNKYFVLFNLSPIAKVLLNPLVNLFKKIQKEQNEANIFSNKFFQSLLIKKSGDVNINYKVENVLKNICDPFTIDILKFKGFPTNLLDIYVYICKGVLERWDTQQNDLRFNRIRSSEIFIHQLVKHVFAAYSKYFLNRLNNIESNYEIDTSISFKNIIESRSVSMLEYINPVEELGCLSRFTYSGGIGAIGNDAAIRDDIRNIHESYYGNVDPMDTPEGGNIGVLNYLTSKALISNKYGLFVTKNKIQSFSELLSVATSLSPFVKSCDGPRVMFSSAHVKQAIPLLTSEQPCVQTGYEYLVPFLSSSSFIKRSTLDGKVIQVNDKFIIIQDSKDTKKFERINLQGQYVLSGQGFKILNSFQPCVKTGSSVKKDDIVAYSNVCKNGILSLGVNALTAVMFWKGYTYEDGYVVSESFAKKFQTFRYHEIREIIRKDEEVYKIANVGDFLEPGKELLVRSLTPESMWTEWDDIIGKDIITYSPGGEIIDIEIYPGKKGITQEGHKLLEPLYNQFKVKFEQIRYKPLSEIHYFNNQTISDYVVIIFKIKTPITSLEEGDKISNRHGGKGCIALIEKDENMPITPWGERVDLILNPLSIINRMNASTLLELYTGLVSADIIKKVQKMSITRGKEYILEIIDLFDNSKNKNVLSNYRSMLDNISDKEYMEYIKNNKHFPIIVSHDSTISLSHMKKILKHVGLKDQYYLHLPELNVKTERPVALGYLYYMQLEHLAREKISARSTGLVSRLTKQPVRGKKLTGGQRVGEYDSYSFLSHGCENALKEVFTALSDDVKAKNALLANILDYGSAKLSKIKITPSKDVFSIYLHGLMLEEDVKKGGT